MLSRRQILRTFAGTVSLYAPRNHAVAAPKPPAKGKIDVHHHVGPPPGAAGNRIPGPEWTPQIAVEEMDRNGVSTGIGFPGGIPATTGIEQGRKIAREYNDYAAQMGRDYPGRFGLFASLPIGDIDGTLAEIAYALDVLKADGFGISTNYGDMWLGDAKLRPIFEELNRRNAVVYVHPIDAPCCTPATLTYEKDGVSGPWLEWPMNTARTIFSLMAAGHTRQFPSVRVIFSHSGGVMPLLIRRVAGFTEWNAVGAEKLRRMFPDGIEAEFRKFYFEGAQGFDSLNFEAIRKLVPASHLLFGTDYNRFPIAHTVRIFEALKLPSAEKHAIERGNAETLLPKWKT